MRFLTKISGIGLLVLAGCGRTPNDFPKYIDLNNDGRAEIITPKWIPEKWGGRANYELISTDLDGSMRQKLLINFKKDWPYKIDFKDFDNDGDIDLVFSKHIQKMWRRADDKTFVAKNDGEENFSEPELIYSR